MYVYLPLLLDLFYSIDTLMMIFPTFVITVFLTPVISMIITIAVVVIVASIFIPRFALMFSFICMRKFTYAHIHIYTCVYVYIYIYEERDA